MPLQTAFRALRFLRRDLRLTLAVVVLLALGIGANAAVFSLADRVLIRAPSGVRAPDRIRRVYLRTRRTIGGIESVRSEFTYPAFQAMDSVLAPRLRLAAYTPPDSAAGQLSMAGQPDRLSYATSRFFSLLGVRPALGRFFVPDEDVMGREADVAVLSYGYWKRRFGRDPGALGRTLRMGGRVFTIVGVAPRDFTGIDLDAADVWVPLSALHEPAIGDDPWYGAWRGRDLVRVIARLPAGTPEGWLGARATLAYRRGWAADGEPDSTDTILTGPIQEALAPTSGAGPQSAPARLVALARRLIAVPLLVALIAAANVASLLLARGADRRREFAIRVALGVPRRRLLGGVMLESVLLAAVAALAALALAGWAALGLRALVAPTVHWAGSAVDGRVAGFAFLLALLLGLGAGLPAALQAARSDPNELLAAGGPRAGGGRRSRLRSGLLAAQTALSFLLLLGAGLFARSLLRVESIDLGYDVERVVAGDVIFRDATGGYLDFFDDAHRDAMVSGFPAAAAALRGRPDIASVAVANAMPMQGYVMTSLRIPGLDSVPRLGNRDPALVAVGPNYFSTSGTRVIRGRSLLESDRRGAAPVLIVNETAARLFWPGRDPLGQCIGIKFEPACATVVGVTADAHLTDVIEAPTVRLYVPLAQIGSATSHIFIPRVLLARAAPGRTGEALAALRAELRQQFPDAGVVRAARLSDMVAPQLRPWRVGADLFTTLGVLALVIATLGVFSVVSYQVRRRTHEVGVRMTLGATPADIVRLFTARGLVPVYAGILLGAAAALAAGRLVAPLLYETSPHDPTIFAGAAALLAIAALAAALLPGWRAARVEPGKILRTE